MNAHSKDAAAVVRLLGSDPAVGLNEAQVLERRRQYGENRLRGRRRKTGFRRFLDQFKDVMILILMAAALVSFVTACVEGDPQSFF